MDENVYLQAGARREVHVREHHRPGLAHAGDLPDDRADRAGLLDRPPDGRERHRQGADRAGDPLHLDPQGPQVRLDQLRRAARAAPRVRALRPRAGGVHRRGQGQARPLHRGRPRHALPRRDLRDDADDAGQAPAGDPGEGDPQGRRQRRDHDGRPHHRGDQQGPDRPRVRRKVPRGPLLPDQRHPDRAAAAALARRRHRPAAPSTSSRRSARNRRSPRRRSRPTRCGCSRPTRGPATCASSRTRSSARSRSSPVP